MMSASHQLCAAHQRGENLVVVLAAAQIARDAMRELLPRRVRVRLQITGRRHHEAGHAERALDALLLDDALLHRAQPAGPRIGQAFDAHDLLAPAATTPLMKFRLENPFGTSSDILLSSIDGSPQWRGI